MSSIRSLAVRTGFLLLLFLFIPSTVVKAQHTVSGQVLSSAGAVSGVTISLTQEGNPVGWSTQTNGEGNYSFGTLTLLPAAPPPNIVITASKPDYVFIPASKTLAFSGDITFNFAATAKPTPDPVVRLVEGRAQAILPDKVADRFGRIMRNGYHAVRLTIFNKLADLRNGSLIGDSIIVSSASILVPVNYEVRYIGKGKVDVGRKGWHPRDLERLSPSDISQPLSWTVWDASVKRRQSEAQQIGADSECDQVPDFVNPDHFELMMGTVDRREARDWRSRALVAAESAATMTSFVTSFIVPINTNDIPTILDKFKNLLIPGFKEYFPSLKDEHRKNLSEDIMRPLEAVAFKDHLQKTVFLPKTAWKNGEWERRISHVCSDPIKIEAVVAKPGDQLPIHSIMGIVTDADTDTGVANVRLALLGGSLEPIEALTDTKGRYRFSGLSAGTYTLTVDELMNCQRTASENISVPLQVVAGGSRTKDFALPGMYTVSGQVTLNDGTTAVDQASVELRGSGGNLLDETKTSDIGNYQFSCKERPTTPYQIVVSKPALTFPPQPAPLATFGSPLPVIRAN